MATTNENYKKSEENEMLNLVLSNLLRVTQEKLEKTGSPLPVKTDKELYFIVEYSIKIGFINGLAVGKETEKYLEKFRKLKLDSEKDEKHN